MDELLHRMLMSPLGLVLGYAYWWPLSVTGVGALVAGMLLDRHEPEGPKLWYLLPLLVSGEALALIPWLAENVDRFGAAPGQLSPLWLAIFAAVELFAIGLAVAFNRSNLRTALLLGLFAATYGVAAWGAMELDVMCWRGC